ncbi:MAG TPA: TRAP transporter small permease subunit, partial [Candidatus Acidoferrum sp.]|nr:TRAP transporter small permease subunit [Candidatus Acidoferrum sp.]
MTRGAVSIWIDRLLDEWLGPAVDWAVGLMVGGLVVMVGSGVLSRYFLNYSLAWSDELAGLLFVWVTLLGSV